MAKLPHTSCQRGKRVRLILKDGSQIISKFVEKKGNTHVVLELGSYPVTNIRAFSIYKPLKRDNPRNK